MNVSNKDGSETSVSVEEMDMQSNKDGNGNLAFGPNDVLSGRHKLSFNHIGNRRFREVVAQSIDDYNSALCRAEKCGIVETIMLHVANSGGRFLKQDDDGKWKELDAETVRQKVAHAIRDTTKKRDAKLKKEKQRESVASKVAQRVMSTAMEDPAAALQANAAATGTPPITRFVTDLNRHLQQSRTLPQGYTASAFPSAAMESADKLGGGGNAAFNFPNPTRNELRHEYGQGMMPFEMGQDMGHSIQPSVLSGPPIFGPGQHANLNAPMNQAAMMAGHQSSTPQQGLLQTSTMGMPNTSPMPVHGTGVGGIHQPPGAFASEQLSMQPLHPEDELVDHDDDFMAKIDDTLGPWQPESEAPLL